MSDDEWIPDLDGSRRLLGEHFKWGWNHENGAATVWKCAGGVDGVPFHEDHLPSVWGRRASVRAGDILGVAFVPDRDARAVEDGLGPVVVTAYSTARVPEDVLEWFRAEYPDRIVEDDSAHGDARMPPDGTVL